MKAEMLVVAYDDMVEDFNRDGAASCHELLGHFLVFKTWLGPAGRMVMNQNKARSVAVEGGFYHFAGVDGCLINGAFE